MAVLTAPPLMLGEDGGVGSFGLRRPWMEDLLLFVDFSSLT